MQWGRIDYDQIPPEIDVIVSFPIPYPMDANDGGMLVANYNKTTLTAHIAYFTRYHDFVRGFTWFAIGY